MRFHIGCCAVVEKNGASGLLICELPFVYLFVLLPVQRIDNWFTGEEVHTCFNCMYMSLLLLLF